MSHHMSVYSLITNRHVTQKRRKEILATKHLEEWIVGYKLRDKLRCSPDAVGNLGNPEVRTQAIFSSIMTDLLVGNKSALQCLCRCRVCYYGHDGSAELGRCSGGS